MLKQILDLFRSTERPEPIPSDMPTGIRTVPQDPRLSNLFFWKEGSDALMYDDQEGHSHILIEMQDGAIDISAPTLSIGYLRRDAAQFIMAAYKEQERRDKQEASCSSKS